MGRTTLTHARRGGCGAQLHHRAGSTRTPERSVTGNVLLTSEFDLSLVVSYQLIDAKTGKVLDSGQANGTTSFFVGNDVTQDERQALPLAAEQLAVRLVSAVAEGF